MRADGQALPQYKIYPLGTIANASKVLQPLWQPSVEPATAPAFYRGQFVVAVGEVADTYLNLKGWGKGVAYINGHPLARYYDIGPQ